MPGGRENRSERLCGELGEDTSGSDSLVGWAFLMLCICHLFAFILLFSIHLGSGLTSGKLRVPQQSQKGHGETQMLGNRELTT